MAEPDWREIAFTCLLSREMDRLEEQQLTPQGKVKYQFSAGGHEVTQVLLARLLTHRHDAAGVYYRSRPFMLASGLSAGEALAAGMARRGSPSEGRDVGVVFSLPARRGATVLPASGDVGAQYTPAAGWAQAILYRQRVMADETWKGAIAAAMGGDGSVAANGFWSALTIATTLGLPMLFVVEDNGYGISVPAGMQTPGGNIAANLASFRSLTVVESDAHELPALAKAVEGAVSSARNEQPTLLRVRGVRLGGHTFVDDQSYKPAAVREDEARRDPMSALSRLFTGDEWRSLTERAAEELEKAMHWAETQPEPAPESARQFLFFGGVPSQIGGWRPEGTAPAKGELMPNPEGPRINFLEAVRRTLDSELALNNRLAVFGEDVGVKGGVHGVTQDLQSRHGEDRVFDTSLSEEGIVGRSIGLALAGLMPAPELQFRKYADPAFEQLVDAGTIRWRTAGKFAAPMVVRIPVGYGKKTGDPWHSVSGEAIYAHTLGWRIAFPSNAADAAGLLRTALRGDDPTFFLEHRALLDTPAGRRQYPGDSYCLEYGRATALSGGDELTIISWGETLHRCMEAATGQEQKITLVDLRTLCPWDIETVMTAVRRCGKVLIAHEDTLTAGFGAEIAASIVSYCFTDLDAPVRRLATPDVPIAYSAALMDAVLPSVERIRAEIAELLAF